MRVIYAGGAVCAQATLKRLLVLSNEVAFSDLPSVTFDKWGTVGMPTPFRSLIDDSAPVKIIAHTPPSGPVSRVYGEFVSHDVADRRFRKLFLQGLERDAIFRERFLSARANYNGYAGMDAAEALIADKTLLDVDLGEVTTFGNAFDFAREDGRRDTLRTLLAHASIHLTTAMVGAQELGLVPVSDDPYLAKLLALRAQAGGASAASTASATASLAFEIVRAVIPDEALQRLDFPDILTFRAKTRDVYAAWGTEVERFTAMIDDADADDLTAVAEKLVAREIAPKMNVLRNELASARDSLFADVVKSAATAWKLPALAVALIQHQSLLLGTVAVLGGVSGTILKNVAEQWAKRRDIIRKHGLAYLVQLEDRVQDA